MQGLFPMANIRVYVARNRGSLAFPCPTGTFADFSPKLQREADFVFSTMLRADVWLAVCGFRIPKTRRASIVHNLFDEDLRFLYRNRPGVAAALKFLWKIAFQKIGTAVVSSPAMGLHYKRLIGDELDIITIPYGISDPSKKYSAKAGGSRKFQLVSCGNLIQRKNFSLVLDALRLLPDCHFTLIGDGPEMTPLRTQAKRLGIEDRTSFIGFQADIASVLSQCDAYVMPSLSEGFGLALLEAMALGIPIACADLEIYKEILPEEIFLRFSPHSPDQLAAAVQNLRPDHLERSRKTREFYECRHQAKLMAQRYVELISGRRRDTSTPSNPYTGH